MKLVNLQVYTPDELHFGEGIQYFRCEQGCDWFNSLSQFKKKYALLVNNTTGVICAITEEISRLYPVGMTVVEVDELPEGAAAGGEWVFDFESERVSPRVYTTAELVEAAEDHRASLLADARVKINEWQSELTLGIISDDEKALLIEWLAYIKALKAVDTSAAPKITWPNTPASST